MSMQHIGAPFLGKLLDRLGKCGNFAPFAHSHRAAAHARRAVKHQPVDLFCGWTIGAMPLPGDAAHLHTRGLLAFQDSTRAKRVPAMQR